VANNRAAAAGCFHYRGDARLESIGDTMNTGLHPVTRRPESRRWSVGVVLAVAIGLMLVVPLAHRALGQGGGSAQGASGQGASGQPSSFPGCGIAPWTGTCTCMLTPNGASISFEAFDRAVRDPNVRPRVKNVDAVLATARRDCRMPVTAGTR
jgi:hypothetical protein